MGNLRRFTLVGGLATLADVGIFIVLAVGLAWRPWLSDLTAVALATVLSWTLHGLVTFPEDPSRRWYRAPGSYLSTALGALVLSVTTVAFLSVPFGHGGWAVLLAVKLAALLLAFLFRVSRYRETMFVSIRAEQAQVVPREPAPGDHRLSVVIPAFNEEDRIAATIAQVRSDLGVVGSVGELEVVVVDDGSTDGTAERARSAGADQVIRHETNAGKGAAVRSGVLSATGRTIAFTDADLSYAPHQILGLMDQVEGGWDVVVGSRRHVETRTVVRAGRLRELGGRVINLLSAYVLLGRYRDTQCGLKAFRSDAARLIFSHTRIDGFAFDIEVFALVERYRLALLEVPVELENSERSTVHVARDAMKLIVDLFRIRANARAGLYESRAGQPVDGTG